MELEESDRREVYRLGGELAKRDPEMAFWYFKTAPEAIAHFSFEDMEKWVEMGLELYEGYGAVPARNFFKGITRETIRKIHSRGLEYEEVARTLELYVGGLSGGALRLEVDPESYTDTRRIALPPKVDLFDDNDLNFKLYKVMAAHQYAQLRYRSFDLRGGEIRPLFDELASRYGTSPPPDQTPLETFFSLFPDPDLALAVFEVLENARVEEKLRREFRGLGRDLSLLLDLAWKDRRPYGALTPREALLEALMERLAGREVRSGFPEELEPLLENSYQKARGLLRPEATAEDTLRTTAEIVSLLEDLEGPSALPPLPHRGVIRPEKVAQGLKETQQELAEKMRDLLRNLEVEPPPEIDSEIQHALNEVADPFAHGAPLDFLFRFGIDLPEELKGELLEEIEKALGEMGEIDSSLLLKVLDSAGRKIRANIQARVTEFQVEMTEEDRIGAFLYDEWDYKMGHYRAAWCALKERTMKKGSEKFVEKTLEKHSGLVLLLRRQFEMLRPEYRKLYREIQGEEVDIDAFIEALADIRAGAIPSEKIYIRIDKKERDIAVAFLVDMSGSTTGWVIETEKEALVLMCEALEVLQDQYAIYGFSGKTRKQCDFYRIKDFEEPYDEEVKNRIAGMEAFDYTRMGPPIRHLTKILEETDAKVKLMVLLSDGKPEDFDEYKGEHGIEDTRKALIEAKRKHIRPFCITIDTEARDYMPHMFGEVSYIILDSVEKLPRKLPEIYWKLTT
jgi:nitric oxide reductase NorD protein